MKYLLAKDKRKRKQFMKKELNYLVVKSLIVNQNIKGIERLLLTIKLHNFKKTSLVRIRNRCCLTGRARAVLRTIGYNRCGFKYYVALGRFVGVRKSSW